MTEPRPFDVWLARRLSRRALIGGGLALIGLPHARIFASDPRWRPQASPFTLGIASGDPTPDGVVLWTRLALDPLNGGGMPPSPVDVTWQIARDERMRDVVQRGTIAARPEWAHSVHVEVDGLDPDRWYWYQFRAGGAESLVGRTRTFPRPGARVDRMRFAFTSCQHFEQGLFTAHGHLARESVDVAFHLGDYIYEGAGVDGRVRKHLGGECKSLDDYRRRYAQYQVEPELQAAQAAFPWIVTPDDHEVDNNYAGDLGAEFEPRDLFLLRRAAAYQAYYEHMPLRRTSIPRGPFVQLYRQFSYGDLGAFFVLDTRQYRTDQPCFDTAGACAGMADPMATMLGVDQERWLFDALDQSRGRWNVLPQQVMMAKVDLASGEAERYSTDQWSAYDAGRTRLLDFLGTRRPSNPVVLTGDIHTNWVNDLKVDFRNEASPVVATEFVVTSMSSGGDGSDGAARLKSLRAENPFVQFYNAQRGYVTCEVSSRQLVADYRVVDYVTKPGAPIRSIGQFVVENGHPGAKR